RTPVSYLTLDKTLMFPYKVHHFDIALVNFLTYQILRVNVNPIWIPQMCEITYSYNTY
ncbi:MAG: hypothetical protein ACI9EK_002911, partial [Psychroserpens sp.]